MTISAPGGNTQVTYRFGAGFLPAPLNLQPAAFKSLFDLVVYWTLVAQSQTYAGTPYSLAGVPVHFAVCVRTGGAQLLYVAPSHAAFARHYVLGWLGARPQANTGPVVTGLTQARYVAISPQGSEGKIADWRFPTTSKTRMLLEFGSTDSGL